MNFQQIFSRVNGYCTCTAPHATQRKALDIVPQGVFVDDNGGERRGGAKPAAVNDKNVDIRRREIGLGQEVLKDREEDHVDFFGGFMVA